MRKYLEYEYTDDDGTVHHVKEEQPQESGWKKSFYVRPWLVFALIVLAFAVFIGSKMNAADQQQNREEQYMSCLQDQFPNGDPSLCDYLNPDR